MSKKNSWLAAIWLPIVLLIVFLAIWAVKISKPAAAKNSAPTEEYVPWYAQDVEAWWEKVGADKDKIPTPDADWILDAEIPDNYIKIIGQNELYAVIGDDGQIERYRHRYRDESETWWWEDVDPHIPESYEAVAGLDNVYRVTADSGEITYLQYTRNSDDSFFFTPVDENGKPLADKEQSNADTIPDGYVHVRDNIYAVYNEYGVLTGYMERVASENGYEWQSVAIDAAQTEADLESSNVEYGENAIGNYGIPSGGGSYGGNYGGGGTYSNSPVSSGESGMITIINGKGEEEKGYTEKETTTYSEHENGMVYVYEMTIIKTYDVSGNLISTAQEGPTEINRYPETELNKALAP